MKYTRIIVLTVFLVAIGMAIYRFLQTQPAAELTPSDQGRVMVTASFYPLYYFISQIGQDKVQVVNITPAGAEPHDYELTSQDIISIQNSSLLVLNGGVEPWADKVKQDLLGKNIQILEVSQDLRSQNTIDESGQTMIDPHIWLSPVLAQQMVLRIQTALSSVDPTNTAFYAQNADQLIGQLKQLDVEYRQGLQTCQSRDIITSHAAFGYLASAYDLHQVPVTGISPDAEPSLQQLTKLAEFARQHQVKYIFFESLVSPKLSQTLAAEVGAQTLVLDPLEGLRDDDMQQGATYFSKMRQNLENLRLALSCQ